MEHYEGLFVDSRNKLFYLDNEQNSLLKTDPLRVLEIPKGIILPAKPEPGIPWGAGGVQYADFTFVEESKTPKIFGGNYEYKHDTIQFIDEEVVYMGPFLCHWGHFICDQISRLWYVLDKVEHCKIAYCGWNWGNSQTSMWGNFLEFMLLLGVKEEQLIDIQKPTQFRNVIVPELTFSRGDYYRKEYLDIFKKICRKVKPDDYHQIDKVYFTRCQFSGAKDRERGEEDLEKFFQYNGYTIIAPEKLSLKQQVFYYQYSKELAAVAGSITHSILFARDGLNVTILNKMNITNGYQMVIDRLVNARITYVDVYKMSYPVSFGYGPFLIGITEYLRAFASNNNMTVLEESEEDRVRNEKLIKWYNHKYDEIYSDVNKKNELESQNKAVKALYEQIEKKQVALRENAFAESDVEYSYPRKFRYELFITDENKKWYRINEKVSRLRKKSLAVSEISEGIVLPSKGDPAVTWALGGVLRSDYTFVEESKTPRLWGGKYEFNHQDIDFVDEKVVFMGPFLYHWGHFLCDMISRLWYVLPDVSRYKIAYCGWNWDCPQTDLSGNFLELLHLLGIKDEQLINVQRPTKFKSVIIPEISFVPDVADNHSYYTMQFIRLIKTISDNVIGNIELSPVDNIYFSRSKYQPANGKERGEEIIETFFKNNGYSIMYPEQMSVCEQIYYWKNAKNVVAIEGSITHTMLFAGDATNIAILKKTDTINGYQRSIDNLCGNNVTYVNVFMVNNPVCFGFGPFLVGLSNDLICYGRTNGMKMPSFSVNDKIHVLFDKVWYAKEYRRIYSVAVNKALLEKQNMSVRQRIIRWLNECPE